MAGEIVEIENYLDFVQILEGEQTNPEVYYFTAPWCAPCRKLAPILEKIAREHTGVTILKIDIEREDNTKVASRYDAMSVPKLILVYENGESVEYLGALTERGILHWLGLL